MTTAAKSKGARKATAPRKAARRTNGSGNGGPHVMSVEEVRAAEGLRPPEQFVPTTKPAAAPEAEPPLEHPYGEGTKVYSYQPTDGSAPIVLPHISVCAPDALFLYDNRHKDELRQCFAWMDRAGVPDEIGRRVFTLSNDEQAAVIGGWFAGLVINQPRGVAPPGES